MAHILRLKFAAERRIEYGEQLTKSQEVADLLRAEIFGDEPVESFWLLAVDVKNRPTAIVKIAQGGGDGVGIEQATIFKAALLANASGVIVAHNHPSGDPTPSSEDIGLTNRIKESCTLLGLRFLDHVIMTATSHYSFTEHVV